MEGVRKMWSEYIKTNNVASDVEEVAKRYAVEVALDHNRRIRESIKMMLTDEQKKLLEKITIWTP